MHDFSDHTITMQFLISIVVPLMVAVVVSVLNSRFSWKNYRKTLNVADLELLSQKISEMRISSKKYWANSEDKLKTPNLTTTKNLAESELDESEITGLFHGAQELLYSMEFLHDEEEVLDDFRQFRGLCTGSAFGEDCRQADIQKVKEIDISGQVLVAKLMTRRRFC